jgi:hypothetical protein
MRLEGLCGKTTFLVGNRTQYFETCGIASQPTPRTYLPMRGDSTVVEQETEAWSAISATNSSKQTNKKSVALSPQANYTD